MALKFSTPLRNARANVLQSVIGASPLFRFYSGPAPATTADAPTGTLLAQLVLPATFLSAASAGTVAQAGTWSTAAALADGEPGYFRIYDTDGTACHIQGVIPSDLAGSPVTAIAAGVAVSITGYLFTEANA